MPLDSDSDDTGDETPPIAERARPVRQFGTVDLIRIVLTLLGASGMVVGAFGDWTRSVSGVRLNFQTFYRPDFADGAAFYRSAGVVMILLGLLTVIGLVSRSGWLTRLPAALGLVAFALFVIELFRAPGAFVVSQIGWGAWLALAGSLVALVAGFLTTRIAVATGYAD